LRRENTDVLRLSRRNGLRLTAPVFALGALAGGCHHSGHAATVESGVVPGVEVLLSDSLHLLRGKRVGLITNHSGRDRSGRSTIDLLFGAPGVRLTALFGPEHGLRGQAKAGEDVVSATDSATGLPIYSLYGATMVPTPAMLADVDVLVYDIQDVGARVYTYEWTLALTAAAAKRPVIVLDRPDPIRGDRVEGGVLDPAYRSLVGEYPVALRYGLTPGELLRYLVGTRQIEADVKVVPMRGWRRSMWFEDTKLPWINPSPNLRSMDAVALYPGTVFFEGTNLTEGRGTDKPFQLIGAGWLSDAGSIARELNALRLPGVHFDSTSRRIEPGYKWANETIPMIALSVTDRDLLRPVSVGVHLLRAVYARHPTQFAWRVQQIDRLAGSDALRRAVEREGGVEALLSLLEEQSRRFARESAPYLLYH
jgi:uncharacterized protein YbbC (DUF1343 family)